MRHRVWVDTINNTLLPADRGLLIAEPVNYLIRVGTRLEEHAVGGDFVRALREREIYLKELYESKGNDETGMLMALAQSPPNKRAWLLQQFRLIQKVRGKI